MTLVICPGIHESDLTDRFLKSLKLNHVGLNDYLVLPTQQYPPYSALHVLQYLRQHLNPQPADPLSLISYSAGVVGTIGAARAWQRQGGKVQILIALDGWGVPLGGPFPIGRVSHDYFTHWSSALLGAGTDSFYAEPPVTHLDLWCEPHAVAGWWIRQSVEQGERGKEGEACSGTAQGSSPQSDFSLVDRSPATAAEFMRAILTRYSQQGC